MFMKRVRFLYLNVKILLLKFMEGIRIRNYLVIWVLDLLFFLDRFLGVGDLEF